MVRIAVIMCIYKRLDKLPLTQKMLDNQTYKAFDFHIWDNSKDTNEGGMGRFILAAQLIDDYDYVIFIDDDQIFETTFIETLVSEAKPNTIVGWYAWVIRGGYFDRTPATNKATYVGTGGMICDINVFKNPKIFEIPKKYWFIEDLWLSHIAKKMGYELLKSKVHMEFMPGEAVRDQFTVNNLGPLKEEFLATLK